MKISVISPKAITEKIPHYLDSYDYFNYQYDRDAISRNFSSNDEGWMEFLSKLSQNSDNQSIIISSTCEIVDALKIIAHIRLTPSLIYSKAKILWINEKDFVEISQEFNKIKFIPSVRTYFLCKGDFVNDKQIKSEIDIILLEIPPLSNNYSNELIVLPPSTSHAITNEWGAYLLSQLTGGQNLTSNIHALTHKENDLFFKYLKCKNKALFSSESFELTEYVPDNIAFNCMLIDDQHKKGWGDVLEKIIKRISSQASLNIFDDYLLFEKTNEEINNDIFKDIDEYTPHVIFLDLRLREEEEASNYAHTPIINFSGGTLLKTIKEKYPHISVIIFTASNKAWNMEQLIQAGADGYFIKPSPEIDSNVHILREEYHAFLELIRSCRIKSNILTAFWGHISTIKEGSTLIKEKNLDGDKTVVEKRIIERLGMFFGLLKRDYEDSRYNKERFYYSDLELAFMTLWSCLNDIQFIYYEKIKWMTTPEDSNQRPKEKNDIRIVEDLIERINIISGDEYEYFLQKRKTGTNQIRTLLLADYNNPSNVFYLSNAHDESHNRKTFKKDYTNNIGEQIAFLLIAFSRGDFENLTHRQFNVTKLVNDLAKIKTKRNELYLTHGNEEQTSKFYIKSEREKREANVITFFDCAELYEIIHFLLTGKYVNIDKAYF